MTPARRPLEHGTIHGYKHRDCRCDACRQAATDYSRGQRNRARAARGPSAAERDAIEGLPGEEWRPVEDHPGYEVSNLGRVRTHKVGKYLRILTAYPNRDGYLRVRFYDNNHPRFRSVHGLVARAFIGPYPDGQEVRHLDDDKSNNTLLNLVYGTRSQNIQDCLRNGTHVHAKKTHCPAGHAYSGENLYVRPNGWRSCRACQRARETRRRSAA